ncbi:MAG: hypothetical protein F4Z66_08230 [Gammaproteobacteria bacterium]|nr:hypothetical protein [Gammaproteobacteria bacterium]
MKLHVLIKEYIVNEAKQRTGFVILLLFAAVGLQAEIENEKTFGTCKVFDQIDNFTDELRIFMRCLPTDRDENLEEEPHLFLAGFDDGTIEFGLAPIAPTSKRSLIDLVNKLFETLNSSDGSLTEHLMEWRFDKAETQKSEWILGSTGVFLYVRSEADGMDHVLKALGEAERFAIRSTKGYAEGIVFDLVDADKSIEEFKKRLELSSKRRDDLKEHTDTNTTEGKS